MFGDLLREYRVAARLTQEELAERSQLSVRAISDLERGRALRPRVASVRQLAIALGLAEPELTWFRSAAREAFGGAADRITPWRAQVVIPRQLPAVARAFTGREREIASLGDLVGAPLPADDDASLTICVISGTAGVGKTALAIQCATRIAAGFPDGQLFVNLRGYDPEQPMSAAEALVDLLHSLGVTGAPLPADLTARAALYRSVTAGKRLVVVLDNACDAEQVRPLLPGGTGCLVLVTSRDALAGLVAREGAHTLDLDLLPPADGVELLRALIGERARGEDDAVTRLVTLCCRLPLALRVAAELVVARGEVPVGVLVDELTDTHRRLEVLDAGGDERTAVGAVLSWSYRHLDAASARMFCLLGLHPGPDIDLPAAAALAGAEPARAARYLGRLLRGHLLEANAGDGRFGMHDLLRAYARDQVLARFDPGDREAAMGRLFDYYLCQAAACGRQLFPARNLSPPGEPSAGSSPAMADRVAARTWFDRETSNLTATIAATADQGNRSHTIRLAREVTPYLQEFGRYEEATSILTHAILAARSTGDANSEAITLADLGYVEMQQGLYAQAAGHLLQALSLSPKAGDQAAAAQAHGVLGVIDRRQGRYAQAVGHQRQALALYRQSGCQQGQAVSLSRLGVIEHRLGHLRRAVLYQQQAVALYRKIGDHTGLAEGLTRLGMAECGLGYHERAARHHEQAVLQLWQMEHLLGQAEALNGLGEAMLAMNRTEQARASHASALAIAQQTRDRDQQACALHGLGRVCLAVGDSEPGRDHLLSARSIYDALGAPEAERVGRDIARCDDLRARSVRGQSVREPRT